LLIESPRKWPAGYFLTRHHFDLAVEGLKGKHKTVAANPAVEIQLGDYGVGQVKFVPQLELQVVQGVVLAGAHAPEVLER
jgi:hypothetical protein